MKTEEFVEVPDSELRKGDVVKLWSGRKTIIRIDPYHGPLKGCIGLAECTPGLGFSLSVWAIHSPSGALAVSPSVMLC